MSSFRFRARSPPSSRGQASAQRRARFEDADENQPKRRKISGGEKDTSEVYTGTGGFSQPCATALVHSFLGPCYERLNEKFRSIQKLTEKEFVVSGTALKRLVASKKSVDFSKDKSAGKKLRLVQQRVDELHKKLATVEAEQLVIFNSLESRAKLLINPIKDEKEYSVALEKHLDYLVADYLGRTNRLDAAKELAQASEVEPFLDLDMFAESKAILMSVKEENVLGPALSWCTANRARLRKLGIFFELKCRIQEFIELCNNGQSNKTKAIEYAKKYFSSTIKSLEATPAAKTTANSRGQGPTRSATSSSAAEDLSRGASPGNHQGKQTMLKMVSGVMGLLMFADIQTCGINRYEQMVAQVAWDRIATDFQSAFLAVNRLSSEPRLCTSLRVGLSALKTPSCQCARNGHGEGSGSADLQAPGGASTGASEDDRPEGSKKEWGCSNGTNSCPACDSNLRYLAAPLPIAHKGQSMLVCRINGQPIDQANPPLAFPNGQLYGTAGLVGISKEKASGGARTVKCPQTGLEIDFSTLRKVYIL
jgi:macrophage erythroblast attacher